MLIVFPLYHILTDSASWLLFCVGQKLEHLGTTDVENAYWTKIWLGIPFEEEFAVFWLNSFSEISCCHI